MTQWIDLHWLWWGLLLIPALGWLLVRRNHLSAPVRWSQNPTPGTWRTALKPWLPLLRLVGMGFLIIALARPQTTDVTTRTRGIEGIDILLTVDLSSSMLSRDLQPNRLEALKAVAQQFVEGRPNDRIGLVAYAGEAFTRVPLTIDHRMVQMSLAEMANGDLEDGTAIGMGLATAVNRLKDSEAKSKVIILMTDGKNNTGLVDPLTAARMALTYGLRVYTVALGTNGTAPTPVAINPMTGDYVYENRPVELDEELLQRIADETGGRYFRATNNADLEAIYAEIDTLEKTKLQELRFYSYEEHFRPWVLLGMALILLEWLLHRTVFKSPT
jgi:Ca-activated chloride channel family protein